jgi:hypothetical protein
MIMSNNFVMKLTIKWDMKTLVVKSFIIMICFEAIVCSCTKKPAEPPTLSLLNEPGFTASDITVPVGFPVKFGIMGSGKDAPITNLVITMSNENGTFIALDSGLYTNDLKFVRHISYGASDHEKWTFTIMDKNRNKSTLSLTLKKDPNSVFGQIDYFPSIKLGCQQNQDLGSFLEAQSGNAYFANSPEIIQKNINIILYYASLSSPPTDFTFSSPGETEVTAYYPNIASWDIPRPEVRYKYDSLTVTPRQFDDAYNDSLIISNYTSATAGKRKFKSARPGYVIPFQITSGPVSGKRGLLKVISVNGKENGFVEFALKIQK